MQAALILAMFSLFIGVMGSFVVGAGSSAPQLKKALTQETETYFRNIERVVNTELTPNQLQVAAPTTTAAQILQLPAIAQLAPGKWGNPLLDAWGNPLRVNIVRVPIALTAAAIAPVTGFVLVSAGPDRTFQTPNTPPSTLAALQGIIAPAGSDDIVATFTDEPAQRMTFGLLNARLERVANAMLREYQGRLADYRVAIENAYRAALQTNPTTPPPNWVSLLGADPSAPSFADIGNIGTRQSLGVTEEFAMLERQLPNGTGLVVSISSTNLRLGGTLQLQNQSAAPSPWSVLNLSIPLTGGF